MSPASGNLDSLRPVQPWTPLSPVVWARLLPWLSHRKASRITAWHGSSHRMSPMSHCHWLHIPSSPAAVHARRLRSLFPVDSRHEHPGPGLTVLSSSRPLHHGPYQIPERPKLCLWLYTQSFSECTQLNIPSITIFQILSEGLFVTTSELLEAELKIVFDDIIFDFLVRHRNKPYSLLLSMCLNEDGKEDFGKQTKVVKALKENHRDLEDLENMWGSSSGVSVCWR
jgi:hypothetical protein